MTKSWKGRAGTLLKKSLKTGHTVWKKRKFRKTKEWNFAHFHVDDETVIYLYFLAFWQCSWPPPGLGIDFQEPSLLYQVNKSKKLRVLSAFLTCSNYNPFFCYCMSDCPHCVNPATSLPRALIKKETKFSSYIRKFRWDRVQSHTVLYMRKSFLIYEETHKFFHHMWGSR